MYYLLQPPARIHLFILSSCDSAPALESSVQNVTLKMLAASFQQEPFLKITMRRCLSHPRDLALRSEMPFQSPAAPLASDMLGHYKTLCHYHFFGGVWV